MPLTQKGWVDACSNYPQMVESLILKHSGNGIHVLAVGSRGNHNHFAAVMDEHNGIIYMEHVEIKVDFNRINPERHLEVWAEYTFTRESELQKEWRCPTYILSLLSPVEQIQETLGEMNWPKSRSGNWRKEAMRIASGVVDAKRVGYTAPMSGDIIEFAEPLYYQMDNLPITRFVAYGFSRGTIRLGSVVGGRVCEIKEDFVRRWYDRKYRIITLKLNDGEGLRVAQELPYE